MNHIQEIIISSAMGILTILAGMLIRSVKRYIIAKGGEKTLKIVEILARNAVNAVEQVSAETGHKGRDKLLEAKQVITNELSKYHIYMSDEDLTVFIESAVKQMNDAWKESDYGN